jgi:hypothetical protein
MRVIIIGEEVQELLDSMLLMLLLLSASYRARKGRKNWTVATMRNNVGDTMRYDNHYHTIMTITTTEYVHTTTTLQIYAWRTFARALAICFLSLFSFFFFDYQQPTPAATTIDNSEQQ